MPRPRVNYNFTPENLLTRMEPGHRYTVYQLAAKFRLKTDDVRRTVGQLVTAGEIQTELASTNTFRQGCTLYFRGAVPVAPTVTRIELSVAVRAGPPDLKSTMVGYDAEISRRLQLCMLARGAR
jgi:hypothetical protein